MSVSDPLTCLVKPVFPCLFWGGAFTGLAVYQGLPKQQAGVAFSRNFGFLYVYNALQCPLETISQRKSWSHNAIAGGALGYLGVMKRAVGIPLIDASFFIKFPRITPPIAGAIMYGGIAGALGAISKPL
jgi:hypothetical protein